jgi:hypothetical protein
MLLAFSFIRLAPLLIATPPPRVSARAHNFLSEGLEMVQKDGRKKDIEKVEARIAFIETGKVALKPSS